MNPWIQVAIPAVVVLVMVVVGLELRPVDFRRVALYPKAIVVGLAGQLVLLPMMAVALIASLELSADTVAGLLLLAACPAGGITNYFTYLARAGIALSVTLTAVATVLAIVTMPLLLLAGFAVFPDVTGEVEVPVIRIVVQLIVMMLLPLSVGMAMRYRWEDWVQRAEPRLRPLSLAAILGLVIWILYDQRARLASELGQALLVAVLFTVLAMLCGLAVGWLARLAVRDRLTLICEFSSRNLGIAILIAVSAMGRAEFLFFAVTLFVTSTTLTLLAVAGFRAFEPAED